MGWLWKNFGTYKKKKKKQEKKYVCVQRREKKRESAREKDNGECEWEQARRVRLKERESQTEWGIVGERKKKAEKEIISEWDRNRQHGRLRMRHMREKEWVRQKEILCEREREWMRLTKKEYDDEMKQWGSVREWETWREKYSEWDWVKDSVKKREREMCR